MDCSGDMSEISYDNFEGFGGDYTRQHRDSIDLVNEIEELKYGSRKLQEENDRLSSQITHADDAYQAIMHENKIMKKKLESMQVLILNIKDMEKEYDDMKESLNCTKAENDDLKTNISEIERERILYQDKAENLEKKLLLMEEDLTYFRLEEKKLLNVVENQEKSLIKTESYKMQLQEDLILKEEKCKEMENIMHQYKEVLETLRSEKTALEHSLLNSQKDIVSQIVHSDADDSDDTISLTGEYELFENWQSEIHSQKIEELSYRNLKDELQEVIEKDEIKSSYLNRLLNLQNIFKTIYAALKENVSTLSRVNSQAASILELENVKENKEKEDPKALLEATKDSFDESIQEQINAELKALRAQIARSQAVLAFLQTKGSSLPQGIEKHSIKWPPQPLEILEGVDIPGNLELYMGYLQREQALPEQPERSRFVRHRNPPNRSNSSTASQKAVPLHRSPLALSCPILPSQTSLVTRATQTEPINSTIISLGQNHNERIENIALLNPDADLTEIRAVSTHNVTSTNISSPCEVNSAIKGIRTCLLAVPNAYQFQESVESPISPSFPRNRSFSFVTAIRKGNPHLVDANDNCHLLSTDIIDSCVKDNQTIVFETTPVKVPDTPPPISSSNTCNIVKDFRPYNYAGPNEDIECNRFPTSAKSSNSCPSRSLHTMHSVPPYPKAVECMKIQTESRQGKPTNEICLPAGDNKEENKCDGENKSKDETQNATDKDNKVYKHTKRRLSGSGQSHNSSPGIVRCPAFDFSEQDDDVTTTAALQVTGNIKRRDTSNKCKVPMPDLKENSETESAKGSANGSFEYEAGEALLSSNQIEINTGTDPAFPSLPDSFLKRIGVHKSNPISVESLSDEEIEAKFNALSLAFKTDKFTLAKRMELHQRQRDITERNIESELYALKELITDLGQHYSEGEPKELICKIQNHVDIIEQSTARVSSRAEIFGSVQQEERLSQAVEIMVNHVENVKQLYKKEHQELEDMRNLWNENKAFDDNSGDSAGEEGKRSLRSLIIASSASKQETTDKICDSHSIIAKNSSCWSRNSESFTCTNTYNIPVFGHFSFTSVNHKWSALSCPNIRTDCPSVIKIARTHSALEAFVGSSKNSSSDVRLLQSERDDRKTVCQSNHEPAFLELNEKYTNGNDEKGNASFWHPKNERWNSLFRISDCKMGQLPHRKWIPFKRFPIMNFLLYLSVITIIMWIMVSFISTTSVSCLRESVINWSWMDIFKNILDYLVVMKYNSVPPT